MTQQDAFVRCINLSGAQYFTLHPSIKYVSPEFVFRSMLSFVPILMNTDSSRHQSENPWIKCSFFLSDPSDLNVSQGGGRQGDDWMETEGDKG